MLPSPRSQPVLTLRRLAARTAVAALMALALVVSLAAPASAHTVNGQGATNYHTTLDSVLPATPGLRVKMIDLGSFIQVTWTGSTHLVIEGYQGEPYLRIGPDGVWRNKFSPATYLNQFRTYYAAVPSYASATATPDWVKLSSGRTATWHDHRTHWMGGPTPPVVLAAPHAFHHVFTWKVTMVSAGTPIVVTGTLDWIPGNNPWGWVALIAVLAVIGIVVGRSRWWAQGLAALIGLLILVDMFHAVGTGLDVVGSPVHKVLLIFASSYYSIVAWVLGIVAIRLLVRRSPDGLFAAIFTSLVVGLFGGLADIIALARSQVPYLLGTVFDRGLISISAGGSLGVLIGSLYAFRRNRPELDPEIAADVDVDAAGDGAIGAADAGG